jgi:SAM-dependent methyltransferase
MGRRPRWRRAVANRISPADAIRPPDDGPGTLSSHVGEAGDRLVERTGNEIPEADVTAMFDTIAPVYDRVNTLMTAGRDHAWRRAAVRATALASGDSTIDVACGTGRLSALLAEAVGPFGHVVGVDLSEEMIRRAMGDHRDVVQLAFQVANALELPFPDASFDAATIGFGCATWPTTAPASVRWRVSCGRAVASSASS